jgi:hypothetical protein
LARVALRRQCNGHARKQGGQQRGEAQERAGPVERVAHAFLRLFRREQLTALRQGGCLRPAAPALYGGRFTRQQQTMAGTRTCAQQPGLPGIGQVHHRARRHRHQFAAVRLLDQLAGNAQIAPAQLHAIAHAPVQAYQCAMIEIHAAGFRSVANRLPALGVGHQQAAAQGIAGIGSQHVQQLAALQCERHAGESGGTADRQAALPARRGKFGGDGLRRGNANVAADQFGRAGQHAALHARGERGHHAQGDHGQHQGRRQRTQLRQVPFATQAAQGQQQDFHASGSSRPSCNSARRMQRSASCRSCVTRTRVVR